MRSATMFTITALFFVALIPCNAQEQPVGRMLLGPAAGIDFALNQSDIGVFGASGECGVFGSGTGIEKMFGGSFSMPSLFSPDFGLTVDFGASMASATLYADPVDPIRIFDRKNERLVELDREYQLATEKLDAYLDLLGRLHITERFSVALGASLRYQASSSYTQSDNVLGPGDYAFSDGQRQHTMPMGQELTPAAIVAGPTLRASYEVPLRFGALLVPELSIRADLTSSVRQASWQRYLAGAKVGLLFDITPSPPEPEPPPPVEPPAEPVVVVARQKPRLAASISLYGIDEQNRPINVTKVHVNEVLYRQHSPLLPAVFFEHDSAVFPERYTQLAPGQTDSFSVDRLLGLDLLDIQHHTLDVVGSRLRENPSSRVVVIGSTSKDESAALARARAEKVRSYLEETWGIARSRIALHEGGGSMERSSESTDDGRADNRRVELSSGADGLLDPLMTEQIVRDFDPPTIKMSPTYDAEAGMKSWTLTITQGSNVIARYSNLDAGALTAPELTWHLASEQIDSALEPLVAQLTVEDSTGAIVTARDEVGLSLERRVTVVDGRVERDGDREQISYSLVGFDYNSANPGRQNEALVREIAALVRAGGKITVTGYTDRIGEEQHNVELSSQRAARVAALLRSRLDTRGVRNVTIKTMGAGIETARFRNDLPEGRVLSRGVRVLVEQTVGGEE